MIKTIISIIVFLLGLYFLLKNKSTKSNEPVKDTVKTTEGFELMPPPRCPTLLLQKGSDFYLYNSNTAKVPGVNPLRFNSLEEYIEFTEWQRSQGIICPILYLQEVYDAQGNAVYKARPSPTDLQGGLPDLMPEEYDESSTKLIDASRDNNKSNSNSYPGFDGHNLYIGLETPLDKMFKDDKSKVSINPMDKNWGGNKYTQKYIYSNPSLYNTPQDITKTYEELNGPSNQTNTDDTESEIDREIVSEIDTDN